MSKTTKDAVQSKAAMEIPEPGASSVPAGGLDGAELENILAAPLNIVVTALQERWRAGRKFGPAPVTIPLAELTDDQVSAIAADPMLKHVIC